jgi:hypothetical protein
MPLTPYYEDAAAGTCACGCGRLTTIATQTVKRRGWVKGYPVRFVSGHNARSMERTAAHRRNIADGARKAWRTKRLRHSVGSTRRDARGYVLVKTQIGHGRWEREHALVVERQIGRRLFPGEVVHHVNGIRDDNRAENLFLCRNVSEHSIAHVSFERLLEGLLNAGIVRFNVEKGQYERC